MCGRPVLNNILERQAIAPAGSVDKADLPAARASSRLPDPREFRAAGLLKYGIRRHIMRTAVSVSLKTGNPAGPRPVSVLLRRSRPGRVVLEFVLPGAGLREGLALNAKNMPSWLNALLGQVEGPVPAAGRSVFGDLIICEDSRLVRFGDAVISDLTARELSLFSALAAASPAVVSREDIICKVWKTAAVPNLVHTHIFNLRRKLPPALAARIQAVPGKGFRYFVPLGSPARI